MSNMFMTWQSCIMNTEQTSENVFTHRNHLFCNDVLPKFNAFLKQASCWKIKMLTKCIDNMTPENYFHPYQPKVWSWKWSCLNLWKKTCICLQMIYMLYRYLICWFIFCIFLVAGCQKSKLIYFLMISGGTELKACVRYFYQFFIFSPNDSPLKSMKSVFYFI